MPAHLLPTTVVGSYPQPDWLVNREMLSKVVPRTRMKDIWRIPEPFLEEAQDDATVLAIRDMERAGIDIITDGEMRRESYSNRFATALEGIDLDKPGEVKTRSGGMTPVPRVVGKLRRSRPVELRDMEFLRRNTDRPAKITLPGPFTMGQQAKDEFYGDAEAMAMDFAVAVNEEAHDLQKAGADVIQLDEPWVRNDPEAARRYAVKAINRALATRGQQRAIETFDLHGEETGTPIVGRVIDKRLTDELGDRVGIVADGIDGRVHHVALRDSSAADEAQIGAIAWRSHLVAEYGVPLPVLSTASI